MSQLALRRHQNDAIAIVAGLAVLGIGMLIVRDGTVPGWEKSSFHAVNDLPAWLYRPLWPFQQLGALAVGPVVAIVAAILRRFRLAIALLIATVAKLVSERAVKALVSRQRPGTSIGGNVHLRGDVSAAGESFVSGHAVLIAAIAGLVAPYLPGRWKIVPWVVVALVMVTRVYVGAHNPLDVVCGAAVGLAIAGAINLALGVRAEADVAMMVEGTVEETVKPLAHRMFERRLHALIVGIVLLFIAAVLAIVVAVDPPQSAVQGIDDRWLNWMISARTSSLTRVAKILSFIGSVSVTLPVRLGVVVLLVGRRRWLQLAAFAGAVITSELCIGSLKALVDRPRPPNSLIGTSGASFPSGHAIAGAVTAFGLVIVVMRCSPRRWVAIGVAAAFAGIMATSRTYLAAHWLTDTIAGACIGTGLALAWPAALELARDKHRRARRPAAGDL